MVATPGRGSGWRQKSLSNIDLTSNHKANGVFRYRYFDGICDLYSKHGDCAEYDDLYGVNPKGKLLFEHSEKNWPKFLFCLASGSCKRDLLYDHSDLYPSQETEACSLRRSRSLAIIREETFNELRITGAHNRRSQLIPRARLIDRNFFKDKWVIVFFCPTSQDLTINFYFY